MPEHVTVVGIDGSPLAAAAAQALAAATLVVGARRHLETVPLPEGALTKVLLDVRSALETLVDHDGPVVVLASGDPAFFGVVRLLQRRGVPVTVHPAVSSAAMAFARAGLTWDVAEVVSAHGRAPGRALAVVRSGARVAVLTDSRTGPREVALAAPAGSRVVVCELLGTDDERVVAGTAAEIAALDGWREPNVVVVDAGPLGAPHADSAPWRAARALPRGWARPDEEFDHRDSMVTKAEVRAWALARLGPAPGVLIWDVGSGSGSVGVECARLGAAVVAVDHDIEQCARTRTNAGRHGVHLQVVHGAAPAALAGLPEPDAVFIGGGGMAVVEAVAALRPRIVVVALAALDRVGPTRDCLLGAAYRVEGVQLAAARLAELPGGSVRLAASNPVVVVTGELL